MFTTLVVWAVIYELFFSFTVCMGTLLPGRQPYSSLHNNHSNRDSVAVIQSSGTSQSRMVHEQGKVVFTIPFTLRDSAKKRGKGYPSFDRELMMVYRDPDEDIRTYLLRYPAHFNDFDGQAYFLTFLGILFTEVHHELNKLVMANFGTHYNLAARWRRQ